MNALVYCMLTYHKSRLPWISIFYNEKITETMLTGSCAYKKISSPGFISHQYAGNLTKRSCDNKEL